MNHSPSPSKRKRADSTTTGLATPTAVPFAPQLNTLTVPFRTYSPAPDSPRTRVAHEFSELQLKELDDGVRVLDFGESEGISMTPARKRAKHDEDDETDPEAASDKMKDTIMRDDPETPQPLISSAERSQRTILETPQILFSEHQSDRLLSSVDSGKDAGLDPDKLNARLIPPSNTPPPRQRDSSPVPQMNIFWQDSEITGHLGEDPDDDGVGINGVGFKPTPAIAYARTQKRRQQVQDWKAREAKEARQRRSERRRGEAARQRVQAEEQKRVVRFA